MSTILNLCKLYFLKNLKLVCLEIILINGKIKPKKITIKLSKYSLYINKSLTRLKTENSELKIQNSSILAIGKLIPNTNKVNSIMLIKYVNYESKEVIN